MRFNLTSRKATILSIAFAAFLVVGAVAGPGLAADIDSETTDTTTQSALQAGDTVEDYDGTEQSDMALAVSATSTDPAVKIIDPDSGLTVHTFSADDLNQTDAVDTGSDGNADVWYFNATASQVNDAFQKVPITSGENQSVTVRIIDNATLDEQNQTMTNETVYLDGVTGRAVFPGTADSLSLATDGFQVLGFNLSVDENAEFEQDNVAINGSGSTIAVNVFDGEGADRFASAPDSADASSAGDWVWTTQLWVNEQPHRVFYEEAPDSMEDSDTYGVYLPSEDEVMVNVGDFYDGEDSVDVRVKGNDAYGTITRLMNFGAANALGSLSPI